MYWKPNANLYPPYLRPRIRRGRGIGRGAEYLPWLKVSDVPSRGTSSKPPGIVVRRPFQLLSEFEAIYFFLTERRPTSVDLREQWPIFDIDRTLELCAQFGVNHGYRGAYPEPFTIDLLITESINGELRDRAASIKTPEDAAKPEVRLRLAVEYAWCRERGIPWTLVDTSAFSKTMLATLRFMRSWFQNRYEPDIDGAMRFSDQFQASYTPNILLDELIRKAAKRLRLSEAVAQNTFHYCAWADHIGVSLTHSLSLDRPLVLRGKNGTT